MFVRFRHLLSGLLSRLGGDAIERQYGAVPYRRSDDGLQFMLVTSRRTGRWIFPKGGWMAGLSPWECAAQEALEEAGVEGRIGERPLGTYQTIKVRNTGTAPIEVEMYPLAVDVVLSDWPEKAQRKRRWASRDEACIMLSEPQLIVIVRDFMAEGPLPAGAPERQ